jgi:hypothetical protein
VKPLLPETVETELMGGAVNPAGEALQIVERSSPFFRSFVCCWGDGVLGSLLALVRDPSLQV